MGEIGKAYFLGELPLQNSANSITGPEPVQLRAITIEACGHNGFEANPLEAWLPITESRNGNTYTAVFHLLSSGLGIQALLLPVALATLGWAWGIVCFSLAFMWQFYTIWLLVQLHESVPGARYSRYLQLAIAAFGPKLGKLMALFPVMYLSGGTCAMLIITGGGTLELFFEVMCEGGTRCDAKPLTAAEWFLVFTFVAIAVAQRPNLNSIAGISFIGAITAVGYCTFIWVLSICKERPSDVSYDDSLHGKSDMDRMSSILNALGIIALAFRGHNLVLEIQGTLPTSSKIPSKKSMWKAVTAAYIIIGMCIFPLAIVGFWAYGNKVPFSGGLLSAFSQFHGPSTHKFLKGLTYLLVVTNCLSSFQIYAMVVFDNLEFRYVSTMKKQCSWWIRSGFRLFFGGLAFLIAVAFPFLPSLAPLIGGITLPLTLAYPCFMWISIKKPPRTRGYSVRWCLNLGLGCLGMVLSVLLVVAAVWNLATQGLNANFFKPQ